MGNGRNVQPYPEHWKYIDDMLADPDFKHVYIDLSWGPVIAPNVIDNPAHLKMTADLIRKYPDRFLYGSDQGATADWDLAKKSYDAWGPLWKEIGPALTHQVAKENYLRIFDQSRRNVRAWEHSHPERSSNWNSGSRRSDITSVRLQIVQRSSINASQYVDN